MKVCIAEKPSVARDIAAIVGATSKKDGYMEGNGWTVTWAFGHLVGLAMPEVYGFTSFQRANLPILPKEFILIPRQIKEGKEYKNDPGVMKQLKIIKELFFHAEGIVVATDAGREGQLIFQYIYDYAGCNKSCERLWISSLTDKAIKEGFQNLKPGSDYDHLYLSAKARSCADWVIGINASQALSIAAGRGSWSLGRVQTPTLAMICSRYLENKDFKPQTYFKIKVHTAKDATAFAVLSADKYDTRPAADEVLQRVRAAGSLRVMSVEKKEVKQEPPLLYDLTTLQKEANSKHGFSAEKTLNIAQALYEGKKISYPRTGSRYISADVLDEIPHLIATLKNHPRFGAYASGMENVVLHIRSVDDQKVTDHHALIITGDPADGLTGDQRMIYDMVAGRMLESFSGKCTKENTSVSLEATGVHFVFKGSVTLIPGWRGVFGATDEEVQDEDITTLPPLAEGDMLPVRDTETLEKQTQPRPLHTEASLLSAMESAGKDITNEDEREAMKESGIGTPATRAAIIETLFAREYIVREKKALVPTNKGLVVYLAVKDKKIADVSMTGQWEFALNKIGMGEMDAATFHRSIEVYASQVTTELLSIAFERTDDRPGCSCPKCKNGQVVFFQKVAKCNNENCGFTVFRSIAKKDLTDTQLTALLMNGKTGIIKGFTSSKGKPFDAVVAFDANYKTVFEFENKGGKKGKTK
ncbi:MAG: DNA topoisomerase 3 [Candidatus Ordinivivax streblomastigis]|uniref:DNA topoisomerase n=2 Tax=root TaxID=1 RepID=A0A5M8NYU2_9BACT|nr:MAG: DNA topoisomerase 3 [Candidatus Ordinivivax streblomastigis]